MRICFEYKEVCGSNLANYFQVYFKHSSISCIKRREVRCRKWVGALVYWLWETTRVQEVVDSNPSAVLWMEMTFFTLICCKNCIVCLKGLKVNKKDAGVGPFKKNNL